MELDERCFKIDKPNAYAMINGYLRNGKLNKQAIWCAVKQQPFPMLITLNRSRTPYKINEFYKDQIPERFNISYSYIVTLDSEYFIENDLRLWQLICNNGLFDIWDPIAPYNRFKCNSHPSQFRIQLLRIFKINERFKFTDIYPASPRIDKINNQNRKVTIKKPVIDEDEFHYIKELLKSSVQGFEYMY